MIHRFTSLKEKLEDKEYIDSLCYKRKNELMVCQNYLTEEELDKFSSIDVGYRIARKRYIENKFDEDFIQEHKRIYCIYKDAITP